MNIPVRNHHFCPPAVPLSFRRSTRSIWRFFWASTKFPKPWHLVAFGQDFGVATIAEHFMAACVVQDAFWFEMWFILKVWSAKKLIRLGESFWRPYLRHGHGHTYWNHNTCEHISRENPSFLSGESREINLEPSTVVSFPNEKVTSNFSISVNHLPNYEHLFISY